MIGLNVALLICQLHVVGTRLDIGADRPDGFLRQDIPERGHFDRAVLVIAVQDPVDIPFIAKVIRLKIAQVWCQTARDSLKPVTACAVAVVALGADLDRGEHDLRISLTPWVLRCHFFGKVRQAGRIHSHRSRVTMG